MSSKSQALLLAMVLVLTVSQSNWYCSNFDTNQVCSACYAGYFLDTGKICQVGNAFCKTYMNDGTGNCATCWDLSHGGLSCGIIPSPPNPYCSSPTNNPICTSCYAGYYINPSNICVVGNPYCKTYTNDGTGNCAQCWESSHSGPTCSATVPITPTTYPYCTTYAANGACSACVGGYYVNTAGSCSIVNQCPTLQPNNVCNSCWAGYTLSNGACILSSATLDPFCTTFVSNVCAVCNPGFYFNNAHNCTLGDHNCYIFTNDGTGSCATCYFGAPVGGVCPNIDPQCVAYNLYSCVACSAGYTVGHIGICVPVIPRCYTYGANNTCTGCFPGDYLSGDVCLPIPIDDPYCTAYNSANNCTACQSGMYVRLDNRRCENANPDCATYNSTGGNCLTCNAPLHLSTGLNPVLCIVWP